MAFACADEPTEPPGSLAISVVAPSARSFTVGETLRLEAEVRDQSGEVLPGVAVAWSSGDDRIVTVSPEGVVTAVAPGTATVTGSIADATGTVQLSVADPEVAVLLSLYLSTNGDDWTHNDNWFEDDDLATWYGVETDSAGRVIGLDLSRNNLAGLIPPRLGGLANLRKLDLGGNELAGEIPGELGGLANLERLDLSRNELDGYIPAYHDFDSGVTGLGALSNLVWLDLSGNRLEGDIPWELRGLTSLEHLDLSGNDLWGGIPASNGDGLDALHELTWLDLSGNQLSGVVPWELGLLAKLETLWLSYNQLEDSLPSELGSLERLTWLMVGDNTDLTGPLPRSFLDLELEVLGYANTGLCVPWGADFRTWLDEIWQHLGTGAVCGVDGDRAALKELYDSTAGPDWNDNTNWLTDEPIGEWFGVRTDSTTGRVTRLVLPANKLTGRLPAELGRLDALEVLSLRENDLTGPIPPELGTHLPV